MNTSRYFLISLSCLAACASKEDKVAHNLSTQHLKGAEQTTEPKNADLTLSLSKGEVLTIAVSRHKEGAEPLMQKYFQQVMPIAQPLGFSPRGALDVKTALAGPFVPNNFVGFYSFPSQAAAKTFAQDPRWPEIKALRTDIWSELRISHFVLEEARKWHFSRDKIYEVRYEWGEFALASSQNSAGEGVEVAVFRRGAHEMLPGSLGELVAIRIIEWPDLQTAQTSARPRPAFRIDSLYTQVSGGNRQ